MILTLKQNEKSRNGIAVPLCFMYNQIYLLTYIA